MDETTHFEYQEVQPGDWVRTLQHQAVKDDVAASWMQPPKGAVHMMLGQGFGADEEARPHILPTTPQAAEFLSLKSDRLTDAPYLKLFMAAVPDYPEPPGPPCGLVRTSGDWWQSGLRWIHMPADELVEWAARLSKLFDRMVMGDTGNWPVALAALEMVGYSKPTT